MAVAEHDFWGTLSAVALAIVGTAGIALIVSRNANTTQVISSTGSAFSDALSVALSPVTGLGTSPVGLGGSSTFPIG